MHLHLTNCHGEWNLLLLGVPAAAFALRGLWTRARAAWRVRGRK